MSVRIGLCAVCAQAQMIENRAGSRFWLCLRSRTDPAFPRYPRLPVLTCTGFSPRPATQDRRVPGNEDASPGS